MTSPSEPDEMRTDRLLRRRVGPDGVRAAIEVRSEPEGRGYPPEPARAAIGWVRRARPDRPVTITTDPDNARSPARRGEAGLRHVRDSRTPVGPVLDWRPQEATTAT